MRLAAGSRLVLATHNAGKLREFADLLGPHRIDVVSAGQLGLPEPEETAPDFLGNARIKAIAAAEATGLAALADDSGFSVAALGGAPGVYSARWAGDSKDFAGAMGRVESELQAFGARAPEQRRAWFISALALVWPDGHEQVVEGRVDGVIVPPRGTKGFGYDPQFLPDGHDRTFGEMASEEKHGFPADGSRALSHRARAFQDLALICLRA